MRSIRALIATSVVAALAITAMAAPASAASMGRMAVINGIPGTKIDICIGSSKEIRSGLKYGGVYKKRLTGIKKLRFRKASPGTCKGKILAGRTIGFPGGSDKTVVVTSKAPTEPEAETTSAFRWTSTDSLFLTSAISPESTSRACSPVG